MVKKYNWIGLYVYKFSSGSGHMWYYHTRCTDSEQLIDIGQSLNHVKTDMIPFTLSNWSVCFPEYRARNFSFTLLFRESHVPTEILSCLQCGNWLSIISVWKLNQDVFNKPFSCKTFVIASRLLLFSNWCLIPEDKSSWSSLMSFTLSKKKMI
jgi:hypothetical protein